MPDRCQILTSFRAPALVLSGKELATVRSSARPSLRTEYVLSVGPRGHGSLCSGPLLQRGERDRTNVFLRVELGKGLRGPQPSPQRAEDVLDGSLAHARGLRRAIQSCLNRLEHMLVLPTSNASAWSRRAPGLEVAATRRRPVPQVAGQRQLPWTVNGDYRPQAVRRHIRLLARKSPLTLTVEPPCCGPENLGRNRTSAPAPLGR